MLEDVTKKIMRFNEDRDWDQFHSPENLAKSICIEAGELLECFQWTSEYDKEAVCEELADIVNYSILLASKLDVDLEQIVANKLKKNEEKYPIEKSKGNSKKYNAL
ncbi:MAG: nucleotide pyrophosphohydrolase [Erysipelotrichaceae bacterium]|nr:nucleotide pyrophosphohydrolase [Erysipelotrichaceae bacterium]